MPYPPSRRRSLGALVSLVAAILVSVSLGAGASSASSSSRTSAVKLSLWALAIDGAKGTEPDASALKLASANHVRAVVTRRSGWTATRQEGLIKLATQFGLLVIEPFSLPLSKQDAASLVRGCAKKTGPLRACALIARTPKEALQLAIRGSLDYVIVYVKAPGDLKTLRPNHSKRTRIIGVVPVGLSSAQSAAWQEAMAAATRDPATSVGVKPAGPGAFASFLGEGSADKTVAGGGVKPSSGVKARDAQPPTRPTGVAVAEHSPTSITLTWKPSKDDTGVTGYRVKLQGAIVANSTEPTLTIDGLDCGRMYGASVDAFDAAGNHSALTLAQAATASCVSGSTTTANAGATAITTAPGTKVIKTTTTTDPAAGGTGVTGARTGGTGGTSPPPGTANVWMSPSGNDAGSSCVWHVTPVAAPGDLSTACASFSRAYQLAPATGGLVLLADGYYNATSGYSCPSGGSWTTPHTDWLTFSPAPGTHPKVTCHLSICTGTVACFVKFSDGDSAALSSAPGNLQLGGESLGGQHIELDNIDTTCQDAAPYPLSTTIAQIGFTWPYNTSTNQYCSAYVRGNAQHVLYKGGSIGPTMQDSCASPNNDAQDSSIGYGVGTQRATDWTFDGIYSHDARSGGPNPAAPCYRTDSAHTENFYFTDVTDVTVKNSIFTGCGNSACIFTTTQSTTSPASANVSIIGNVITGAVDFTDSTNAVYAYNDSPGGGLTLGSIGRSGNSIAIVGNIADNNPCPGTGSSLWAGGVTYSHNIWIHNTQGGSSSADKCGATDVVYNVNHDPLPDIFVNWTGTIAGDYHLKTGTNPAVDIGDPAGYSIASLDIFGQTRYCGTAPDAGAAERCP